MSSWYFYNSFHPFEKFFKTFFLCQILWNYEIIKRRVSWKYFDLMYFYPHYYRQVSLATFNFLNYLLQKIHKNKTFEFPIFWKQNVHVLNYLNSVQPNFTNRGTVRDIDTKFSKWFIHCNFLYYKYFLVNAFILLIINCFLK